MRSFRSVTHRTSYDKKLFVSSNGRPPKGVSQVKSSQIYLYSTFHLQNNSKCFTDIKALQQGAEKALQICKRRERKKII